MCVLKLGRRPPVPVRERSSDPPRRCSAWTAAPIESPTCRRRHHGEVCHVRLPAGRAGIRIRRSPWCQGRRNVLRARRDRTRRDARSCRNRTAPADVAVPWLRVADARLALAALSAEFYGHPSRRAHARRHHRHERQDDDLVPADLHLRGGRHASRGRIGTVGYRIGAREIDAARTTPEAPDLQRHAARDGVRRVRARA